MGRSIQFLILTVSLISVSTYIPEAFSAQINCSDGGCGFDASLDIRNDSSTPEFNQFEVRELSEDLQIVTPEGNSPRSARAWIESIDEEGQNLTLSLPSKKPLNAAGNAVIIGPTFKDLLVNLDGRNGDGTPDASMICSEKILNDEYGPQIKSRYLLARLNDSSLPHDRCVPSDLMSIQENEFSCASGQAEFNGINLIGNRWTKRRVCEGESERKMCIKRRMRIKCTWIADRLRAGSGGCDPTKPNGTSSLNPKPKGGGYAGRDWECDPNLVSDNQSGWKLNIDPVIVDEDWVQSRRHSGMSDGEICDEITGRNTTYLRGFPDIAENWIRNHKDGSKSYRSTSTPNEDGDISVRRGNWLGTHSKNYMTNGYRNVTAPASTFFIDAEYKPCYGTGMHSSSHLNTLMNWGCNTNMSVVVEQYHPKTYLEEEKCTNPTRQENFIGSTFTYTNDCYPCHESGLNSKGKCTYLGTEVIDLETVTIRSYETRMIQAVNPDFPQSRIILPLNLWTQMPLGQRAIPYTGNQSLPVTIRDDIGGKGHTDRAPTGIKCYSSMSANGLVCEGMMYNPPSMFIDSSVEEEWNNKIGEAFGYSQSVKMRLYGPHGRYFEWTVLHAVGRY